MTPYFTNVPASWIAKVVVQDLESPVTLQFATKKDTKEDPFQRTVIVLPTCKSNQY